jgi:hypothetical protein
MLRLTITTATLWFQFHSSFWPNLHHFLYQEARIRHRRPLPAVAAILSDTAALTPAEQAAWNDAVTYYDTAFAQRQLGFDPTLIDVNYALADADSSPLVAHQRLPAPLVTALTTAAPIYRRYFWAHHDSANRAWIAATAGELAAHGDTLALALTRVYRVPFPGAPVRVEVVAYASWAGAYTTINPTLITISSQYERHRGSLGLEQLVHETSHAMMDSVDAAFGTRAHRGDVEHTIIFFTAGELVRREIPSHTPFAEVAGLWAPGSGPLAGYYPSVAPVWREYLEGRTSFHDALRTITSSAF